MWRCVDPGLTDVSEEHITTIFRVEKLRVGNQHWQVAADWAPVGNNQLYKNREGGRVGHMWLGLSLQPPGDARGFFFPEDGDDMFLQNVG
jgi:hypothetical protein